MDEFRDEEYSENPFKQVESQEEEFVDQVDQIEAEIAEKQDEFLDVYSKYLVDGDEMTKNVLKRKTIELEMIDPNFDFTIE